MTLIQTSPKSIKLWVDEPAWQPWVNTVAYYPLNSTTTVNDMSGNGLNLTNTNATFGTYNGVSCVKFSWNWVLRQSTLTTQYIWQTFTWNVWVTRGDWSAEMVIGTYNNSGTKRAIGLVLTSTYIDYAIGTGGAWVDALYYTNTTSNQWYNIVITHDSSWNIKGYLNWQQVATWTATVWEWASNFGIWASVFKENEIYYSTWTASEVIIENKTWTADEISSYYNDTKANYWIS